MRSLLITIFFAALGTSSFAQESSTKTATIQTATANYHGGYYIFVESRPVCSFRSLGEVKVGAFSSGAFRDTLDKIVAKARKQYGNNGNGIILRMSSSDAWMGDVIQISCE